MGMAEEIRKLPGGAALADLLEDVAGNPEAIRKVAGRWRGAGSGASERVGRLGNAVKDVNTAWEGDSAGAFEKYMRQYGTAGSNLHDALTDSAKALDDAAESLETAKSKISALCGTVLDRVGAYKTANPDVKQADLDSAIKPLVDSAYEQAKGHYDTAGTAVDDAWKLINGYWKDRGTTFVGINNPKKESFDPESGGKVEWVRTELPDWQKTALAGADGSGSTAVADQSGGGGGAPSGGSAASGGSGTSVAQAVPFVPGGGTGADIVNAARQHLGKPYVWGANGPSSFDCSGLVYYTLNQAGIKIGDTTAAGYQASGQPISGAPQPGDIVFFGQPPSHVGVYIGDGKMIHAPHPGTDVQVGQVAVQQGPITYRRFTK